VHFRAYDDACPLIGYAHKTVLIEVGTGAVASASPGTCPSVDFTASACQPGSYTYTWSGDAGFSSTLQNPSFTYPAIGDYAWQVIVAGSGINDTIRDTVHISGDPVVLPTLFLPDTIALGPCIGPTSAVISFSGSYFTYMSSTGTVTASFPVNQAGTYRGWATTVAGCAYMDSVVVTWTDPDISGIARTSTAPQLVNQKIYLIRYDSVAQALYAADSAFTDASGYYFFCGVTDTIVYLKAAPDSAAYPNEMPTYADTALFWSQALAFYPLPGIPVIHNFTTLAGANPGGPGFIGGLITQGANKASAVGDPVPGLTVFLKEALSGAVYAVARTDANGYFRFSNLPLGAYKVIPDKPQVSIVNVPQVSLTAQVPSRDSLDFRLNSTFLELYVASGVRPGPFASAWSVTPNPFGGEAALQVKLATPSTVEWRVLDVLGKVAEPGKPSQLYPAGRHRWALAQNLAPGIYFVELRIDGEVFQQKVLKAR
jgi:PKD repeat protein